MIIFFTVGTTKFEGLIEAALSPDVLRVLGKLQETQAKGAQTELILQLGQGARVPSEREVREAGERHGVKISHFRFTNEIDAVLRKTDVIVSHAGAGSVLRGLRHRKKLIVVVNDQLMDNHQKELASGFAAGHSGIFLDQFCLKFWRVSKGDASTEFVSRMIPTTEKCRIDKLSLRAKCTVHQKRTLMFHKKQFGGGWVPTARD
jgi:beta-1,4-N-acetylglucosaminyltransferase